MKLSQSKKRKKAKQNFLPAKCPQLFSQRTSATGCWSLWCALTCCCALVPLTETRPRWPHSALHPAALRGSVCRDQSRTGFYIHCVLISIREIWHPAVDTLSPTTLCSPSSRSLPKVHSLCPLSEHSCVFALLPVRFGSLLEPLPAVAATTRGRYTSTLTFREVRFHHRLEHRRLPVFPIYIYVCLLVLESSDAVSQIEGLMEPQPSFYYI